MPLGPATGGCSSVTLVGTAPPSNTFFPLPEQDRVHPEVETVEELLAQERLDQIQASDHLHAFMLVPDLAHSGAQIRAELGRARPRQIRLPTGSHVLRDAVEQLAEFVASGAASGRRRCRTSGGRAAVHRCPRTRSRPVRPETSSISGACQPPNANPSGSSSGPPGACATRSRVANISISMSPMALLPVELVVSVER